MALDEQTYEMHRYAAEGKVFYKNLLADANHVQKYFPKIPGQMNYEQDPHLSFPVTSDVINRVASLLHSGMTITCENTAVQEKLEGIMERNDWDELSRDLLVKSLAGGNYLLVNRVGWEMIKPVIFFEAWPGEYCFRDVYQGYETLGYMYLWKDDKMHPILSRPTPKDLEERVHIQYIDDTFWWDNRPDSVPLEHNFGFTPATFFRAVDKDDDNRYGVPFFIRFREMLIEYCQIYSQMSKAIKVLQNVWATNKDREDPTNPINLTPDMINYLGTDGRLEQIIRQLDLTWEANNLDRLKAHISGSAQVPDFMTGLRDVGKVDSGIALSIVTGPLQELMGRIRNDYKPKATTVLTKAIDAEFMLTGQLPPEYELIVQMNEAVIPVDQEKELNNVYGAVDRAIITAQEARPVVLPMLGLEVDE